jgi:hypothetical protein
MQVERTKYKRATPKTSVEYSHWKLDLGAGLDRLLLAAAKVIEKIFGILYMNRSSYVFI